VTDGILWQAPVFGIFSEILGKPRRRARRPRITITNQAVSTEDMQIAAGAFTARSRGQLGFDGKLDFRVEAQFPARVARHRVDFTTHRQAARIQSRWHDPRSEVSAGQSAKRITAEPMRRAGSFDFAQTAWLGSLA